MRILLLNQFFYPDPAPTARLLADVAHHLLSEGHQVTVISSRSSSIPSSPLPVVIYRLPTIPFTRGPARLLSYLSFLFGAAWRSLRIPRPDVVVTLTTPPLLSLVGTLLKLLRRSRHYIWEMDVYPDVAVDLGVLRERTWTTRLIGRIADASRRRANGIIALGDCMRFRLLMHGIPRAKIHVAENWEDGRQISPLPYPDGPLTVLYSGNLGLAHDVDTIALAMDRLKDDPRFRFIFVGDGPRKKSLEEFCSTRRVGNVTFLPYRNSAELSESLSVGHAGLVTQRRESCGSVVPSKIYALMAAGRAVLFIGPREATPARTIERFQCGWQIDCGDISGLTSLLELLASDREMVRDAGLRARQAFEQNFDLPLGVLRVSVVITQAPCTLSSH